MKAAILVLKPAAKTVSGESVQRHFPLLLSESFLGLSPRFCCLGVTAMLNQPVVCNVLKARKLIASTVAGALLAGVSFSSYAAGDALEGQVTGTKLENARYISVSADGKVTFKGFTTPEGEFLYREGDTVSFYIGDILLGKADAGESIPLGALVDGAKNKDALGNLLRFLQSIDSDVNLLNGIQISENAHYSSKNLKVDFDKAMKSFEVQASLNQVLALATNSPSLPAAIDALTNFRMALLDAYGKDRGETVLNLMNTKWSSTLVNEECPGKTASLSHNFNILGHVSAGTFDVNVHKNGKCGANNAAIIGGLWENDALFSCAKSCTLDDLNTTVSVNFPSPHQASLVHEPGSNIITVIHQYPNNRTVIETMVKK
ncbi:Hypothetical protein HDN1F_19690 [gamma proteobacterium HdN1]|nr:Hypothetical protein HDN1F_19690 [gamma proteobacterium HdN1]